MEIKRKSLFEIVTNNPTELEILLLKSRITSCIISKAKEQDLSQKKLSKILCITQPRISNLLQGKLNLFSLEALFGYLVLMGIKFSVKLED